MWADSACSLDPASEGSAQRSPRRIEAWAYSCVAELSSPVAKVGGNDLVRKAPSSTGEGAKLDR